MMASCMLSGKCPVSAASDKACKSGRRTYREYTSAGIPSEPGDLLFGALARAFVNSLIVVEEFSKALSVSDIWGKGQFCKNYASSAGVGVCYISSKGVCLPWHWIAKIEDASLCSLATRARRWPVFSPSSKYPCWRKFLLLAAENSIELYRDWASFQASWLDYVGLMTRAYSLFCSSLRILASHSPDLR